MEDVNISKFRAQVVRSGSTPASPGFVVSEGQNPVDPSGSGQNHLPVTIATASTGLSITESQVLGGAGTVGQYIRGDGSLADFPATTGGGSSVSYYLNGSISQGTIGGVAYKELNRTPIFGAGTDISISADGYIASFITDALDPNKLLIPAGNWNFETYFSASSSGGSPSFYIELYKYNGTTFTLIATSSASPELIAFGTSLNPYYSTLAVPETVLALTDRLALRYYVTHSGRTITLHTENGHLCQVITTFTTGLTALNGLTSQVQFFAVGTSGTDFGISSASDTHTFNLPTASATNRGALSSADWTTFNNKTSNLGTVTSVGLSSATSGVTIGSSPVTTSGTITLAIATASGSQNGLLSSTDWTTFNGKQNALTNPVTGTGTTNYLPKFTGASTIGNSQVYDSGTGVVIGGAATTNGFLEVIKSGSSIAQFSFGQSTTYRTDFFVDATGNFYIQPQGTTRLTLFSDGNTFIGTSPSNAGFKLDVNGTGRFSGQLSVAGASSQSWGGGMIGINIGSGNSSIAAFVNPALAIQKDIRLFNAMYFDGTNYRYNSTGTAANMFVVGNGGDGGLSLFNAPSGTSGNILSLTKVLDITSTGAATFSGTGDDIVTIGKATASQNAYLQLNAGSAANAYINSIGSGKLILGANGAASNHLSITSSGIIDITGPLIIRGTLPADQTDAAVIDHFSNTMRIFSYGAAGVTGDFQFRTAAGGAGSNLVSTINGTTGAYTAVSDINQKKDFEESTIGLDAILGLKPTLYRMKSETNTQKHLGFIAQEVRQYIPNAYVENGEFIGLNEMPIIAALVKSIQELNEKIK